MICYFVFPHVNSFSILVNDTKRLLHFSFNKAINSIVILTKDFYFLRLLHY